MNMSSLRSSGSHKAIGAQRGPRVWDWLPLILSGYIAFICFDQAFDMNLTMLQSSDFLDCIFTGKPFTFYGYVLQKAANGDYFGGNEFTTGASYNILIYITMAVWTLPIYLLNRVIHLSKYMLLLNLWGRLLVIGLSVVSARLITRLSKKWITDPAKSAWAGYFYLSSPLFIYCVIIQNQYDVLSIITTLLALFFYFDKKLYKFSAIMSIAFCYKLFPVIIFVPLILLAEKRIAALLRYAGIFVLPYLVTTLAYAAFDSGYLQSQNNLHATHPFFETTYAARIAGGVSNISLFFMLMVLICVIAYYAGPAANTFPVLAFLLCSASLSCFFIFVGWHPQWFILLLPFLTLTIFSMKNFRLGMLLEIGISASFLLISYMRSFGVNTMNSSILAESTSGLFTLPNDFNKLGNAFDADPAVLIPVFSIFVGFLCAFLLVAYLDYRAITVESRPFDNEMKIARSMLYVRTLLILLFMLQPLAAYFSHPK